MRSFDYWNPLQQEKPQKRRELRAAKRRSPAPLRSIRWPLLTLGALGALVLLSGRWSGNRAKTVVYQSVELQYGEDGAPVLHSVYTNRAGQDIVALERGMLAYDKDGQPLRLHWDPFDPNGTPTYSYLYSTQRSVAAGETSDPPGGWTLCDLPTQVTYALYCDKSIAFEDGTIWENPSYEDWLAAYEGKPVEVKALENYYPFVQKIEIPDAEES